MRDIKPSQYDSAPAINAASASGDVIVLDGRYSIETPLRLSSRVVAAPGTRILYRGRKISGPAITITGQGSGLENATLDCQKMAAGIYCDSAWYTDDLLRRVRVEHPLTCGVRLTKCWNGNIRDVRVVWCDGVALWATQSNSARMENIQVAHCNLETDNWPEGMPDVERAAIVVTDSSVTELDNVLCEPVSVAPYPAIYLRSCATSVRNVRIEAGKHGIAHIVVDGDGWWTGSHISIEQVAIVATNPVAECLVDVRGKARDIIVRQVMASKYLKRIVNNPNNNPGVELSHCTPAA